MKRIKFLNLAIFLLLVTAVTAAQDLTVKEIMAQPSIAGSRVSGTQLSPDGRWIAYLWNSKGNYPLDLYLKATDGSVSKVWLPHSALPQRKSEKKKDPLEYGVVTNDEFARSRRDGIGNIRWAPDSSGILFTYRGDIHVIRTQDINPRRVTKTQTSEFSASYLDQNRILFQQGGNLFSIDTKNGTLAQISREANRTRRISVFGGTRSRNGSMMAYVASDGSKQRPLYVPNYLPYYTAAPTVRRGWTKFKIYANKTDGSWEKSKEILLPKQEGEAYVGGMEWLSDNRTLIVSRVDRTHKRRQMFAIDVFADKPEAVKIFEETDDKWVGRISRIIESHPTNPGMFLFTSEKDTGYNHLHIVEIGKSDKAEVSVKRVTSGDWEIGWASWFDDTTVLFSSTKEGTAERTFQQYQLGSKGETTVRDLFKGMRTGFQLENKTLIFNGSDWRTPADVYSMKDICISCKDIKRPKKITDTVPAAFMSRKWNEPKFQSFKARDGKNVPAKVYFPSGFDKSKKYPMAVFVHGAGYLQNVINGWNNYYREFMFNQLLTQKGYVVLDIDYRGSAGYGRDWRTDVHDFLGGLDFTDHVDGIEFMEQTYNIDKKRVGVYGGSYGGFMAAMLAMRAPEQVKAAAALRPVMDWKNYYAANPFYTSQRLGDPKKNPAAYKRSSPIAYSSKLERKLLILHGILDANVHVQDSIQLVEQLIRDDKTEFFELMLYPAERHGFQRPASWEDEYERILQLFEEELK